MAMVTITINRMKRVISPIIRFLFNMSYPFPLSLILSLSKNIGAYLSRCNRDAPGEESTGQIITSSCHISYGYLVLNV
jgi:hypothetical protein